MEKKDGLIQQKGSSTWVTICGADRDCCITSSLCTRQKVLDPASGKVISNRCVNCSV